MTHDDEIDMEGKVPVALIMFDQENRAFEIHFEDAPDITDVQSYYAYSVFMVYINKAMREALEMVNGIEHQLKVALGANDQYGPEQ